MQPATKRKRALTTGDEAAAGNARLGGGGTGSADDGALCLSQWRLPEQPQHKRSRGNPDSAAAGANGEAGSAAPREHERERGGGGGAPPVHSGGAAGGDGGAAQDFIVRLGTAVSDRMRTVKKWPHCCYLKIYIGGKLAGDPLTVNVRRSYTRSVPFYVIRDDRLKRLRGRITEKWCAGAGNGPPRDLQWWLK